MRYQVGVLTAIGVALSLPIAWGVILLIENRSWRSWLLGWVLILSFFSAAAAAHSWAAYGDPLRVGPIGAAWRAWQGHHEGSQTDHRARDGQPSSSLTV